MVGFLVGNLVQTRREGFFVLQVFFEVVSLKMLNQGDLWRDPKEKSILRGENEGWKQRLEGLIFQGPWNLMTVEPNQVRNARPQYSKHCTSGSRKCLFTNINKNYFGLEGGRWKEAFLGCMRRLFEDAISGEE